MRLTFSIHEYDCDGKVAVEGIFLHFGDVRINIGRDLDDLKYFVKQVLNIQHEIIDGYAGELQ